MIEDKVITAAGVPARIDMALAPAAREAGDADARAIQLPIEYEPEPPFDSGSPAITSPDTKRPAQKLCLPRTEVSSVG